MAVKKRKKTRQTKESPKSDESTAPEKNQAWQIKTANKIAAYCRAASGRDASTRVCFLVRSAF